MAAPNQPNGGKGDSGCLGFLGIVLVLVVLAMLAKCGGRSDASEASKADVAAKLSSAIEAQGAQPVQAVDPTSIDTGLRHFNKALAAEGLPGAMIYSQNCFDALSHDFSWRKLDACGTVDAAALRALKNPAGAAAAETAYFEGETAAKRYLAAATAAGDDTVDADDRLAQVRGQAAASAKRTNAEQSRARMDRAARGRLQIAAKHAR